MFGPICQSCGMPLSKDEKGGGSEKDGSKSTIYCSRCYQDGKFVDPTITIDQMVVKVTDKMKEVDIPGFIAGFLTKSIPNLKRWKNE